MVVVAPLISLMDDHVSKLRSLGISAVNISSHEEEEEWSIFNGEYVVEMLHSCTPAANKHNILESFQTEHGTIRVLIATIAFGMEESTGSFILDPPKLSKLMYKKLEGQVGMVAKVLHMFYIMELC